MQLYDPRLRKAFSKNVQGNGEKHWLFLESGVILNYAHAYRLHPNTYKLNIGIDTTVK